MKKIHLFLLTVLVGSQVAGQERTLLQKTADTICSCMNKVQIKDTTDANEYKSAFMTCFATSGMSGLVELATERGLDMTDSKAMESIGLDIGKELLRQNCKAFIRFSIATAEAKGKSDNSSSEQKTEGILTRVENKEFRHLIVKDKSGRDESFIWFDYFPGSDELVGNNIKNFIGKKVVLSWTEKEVYLPGSENYFKLKQITRITFLK